MWVAPEARGIGAGEALVSAVVGWARSEAFDRLYLKVADHNDPAIALYDRKGFRPTGEVSTLPPPRQRLTQHIRLLEL